MNISRDNYEKYFLDYLEGDLDPDSVAELKLFLLQNPDLEEELQGFEEISLEPENIVFTEKKMLFKPEISDLIINESNFDDLCIARLEGDLTQDEAEAFDTYLGQNPEKQKEYDLFKQTVLKPDQSDIFENKRSLKRYSIKTVRSRIIYYIASAAASVIILFSVIYTLWDNEQSNAIHIADNKTGNDEMIVENTAPEEKEISEEKDFLTTTEDNKPENSGRERKNQKNIKVIDIEDRIEKPFAIANIEDEVADAGVPESEKNNPLITGINRRQVFIDNSQTLPQELLPRDQINEYNNGLLSINGDFGQNKNIIKGLKDISAWDIADLSVKGLGKLTGWDVHMNNKYDENGKVKTLAINAEGIGFSTNLKNN